MNRHVFWLRPQAGPGGGLVSAGPAAPDRRYFLLPIVIAIGLAALTGCAPTPTPLQLDRQLMTAETSPIPGATAKVLPAPAGVQSNAPPASFCVTDAGYCPLAAASPAGQNCICQAGSLMYGGKTNAAPQTYKAPFFSPAE
jgi:hypothetical protein